jgi:hypothetical protein
LAAVRAGAASPARLQVRQIPSPAGAGSDYDEMFARFVKAAATP